MTVYVVIDPILIYTDLIISNIPKLEVYSIDSLATKLSSKFMIPMDKKNGNLMMDVVSVLWYVDHFVAVLVKKLNLI